MNFNPEQDIKINKVYKKTGASNKKIKVLLMVLFFVLVGVLLAYSYVSNNENDGLKNEFFEKIENNDLAFFADNELYEGVAQKLEEGRYNSSGNINLSTNMASEMDLSKFEFLYDLTKDEAEDKSYAKLMTRYSGNDVIAIEGVKDGEKIAVKSDEIVNKYVGTKDTNFEITAGKILGKEVDLSSQKILKNFLFDREWINLKEIAGYAGIKKYVQIFKENASPENFSKKENVVVTLNNTQVTTTEYMAKLDEEQVQKIFEQISEAMGADEKLISKLVVSSVEEFENEETGIIDYSDNDNIIEVPGEENNFNATINIWGNQVEEQNIVTNEVTPGNNSGTDNSVGNNVTTNSTETNNTISNNTVTENVVNETVNNTVINQPHIEVQHNSVQVENVVQEENEVQQEPQNTQPENSQNEVQNTVIEEEENLRTQGFIEVNEGVQIEDETPFIVGENFNETLKNIDEFTEKIEWSTYLATGAKANCTAEQLTAFLEEAILDFVGQETSLIVKIYVAQNETVKLKFEFPEIAKSFDVEIISVSDNEKYLNIKLLKGQEESQGYTVSLYKKVSEAGVKSKINIKKIYKSKISKKLNINLDTKVAQNSKKYTNNIEILFSESDGEFEAQIKDVLNFDISPEVVELNDENCLFIDELSDEEFGLTKDAIVQKIREVLSQKNRDLKMISGGNSIVEQIMANEQPQEGARKEEVKQVLIDVLSNKMREYQESGIELKLQDLQDLQIPGYEVEISISSNLAIITVNGFGFKLDSDFNLSDS